MKGDPYWTSARFRSTCTQCKKPIERGARIFYYPRTRAVYCDAQDCGKQEFALFVAAQFDEEVMTCR